MKNFNYSIIFTDFLVSGSVFDMSIQRTYNSRTLHNGIFGFGWCSDFETSLNVTPDGSIRIKECGGGLHRVYSTVDWNIKIMHEKIDKIISIEKELLPDKPIEYFTNLRDELLYDEMAYESYAKKLGIIGHIKKGIRYYNKGRLDEYVTYTGRHYIRTLPNDTFQRFDLNGNLLGKYDLQNNELNIEYIGGKISSITNSSNQTLLFRYDSNGRINKIVGPKNKIASYSFEGANLVESRDFQGDVVVYSYDDLHNLERVGHPDNTFEEITYDQDRDWVTSFTNRNGCTEKYSARKSKSDPLNHYWAEMEKECNGQIVDSSLFEFIHLTDETGRTWLSEAKTLTHDGVLNKTKFHPIFGKVIEKISDSYRTTYSYDPAGRLRSKKSNFLVEDFRYDNICKKLSHASKKYRFNDGEISRSQLTFFYYDKKKCALESAITNKGKKLKLGYTSKGQISQISVNDGPAANIEYDSQHGKPSIISISGIGKLRTTYYEDGSIKETNSDNPNMALKVANIFNQFNEIIEPTL